MERRCASYARYSSDLQRDSSIADQHRNCRSFAARQLPGNKWGPWVIQEGYVCGDEALSGASLANRKALQSLLSAAKQRPRPFDCVLIDDTSRLARNLPDALRFIEILNYNGVHVVSVTQGIDTAADNSRMLLTMHGMVDEQFLVGHRQKVHRGQEGRVLQGLNPGGRCFGYLNVPIEDTTRKEKYGRPAVTGVRQEIEEDEAGVLRRIFQMYADGTGLAGIAKRLNAEGVPSPKPAKNRRRQLWSRYSIREMLHNERYRGVLVWNRTQKTRDPETGRKVSKARPKEEWMRVEAPQLRIVPEDLWIAAHKQNAAVNGLGITRMGGLCRTQRSRTYLFSGLLECSPCGSSMVIISGGGKGGYVKYGCHAHKHSGVCENNWTIRQDRLEQQLLSEIEARVLKPEIIEYFVQRCQEELRQRLSEMEQQRAFSNPDALKGKRDGLRIQAARLAEAVALGGDLKSLIDRLKEVEAELKSLDQAITNQRPRNLKSSPEQIREEVIRTMMQFRMTLNDAEVAVARNALRKHVGRLVLTPTVRDGRRLFWVSGNVTPPPERHGGVMQLVARDGLEPPTPAFSGLLTDNAKAFRMSAGAWCNGSYWKTLLGLNGMN